MRLRFASGVLFVLAAAIPATGFDRHAIEPGDTVLGEIDLGRTYDEYTMRAPRGSTVSLQLSKAGGAYRPIMGLYTEDYLEVPLVGTSASRAMTLSPVGISQRLRIIVGSGGSTIGAYRLKATVKPAKSFTLAGTPASPA